MNDDLVNELVEYFGSKAKLARALGVKKPAISWWIKNGVPAFRAVQIESLTCGKIKAVRLMGLTNE